MNHDLPLYGELVIPFNAENHTYTRETAVRKTEELRLMVKTAAYHLAKKRGFIPRYKLEDWLNTETQILRSLK
jgi:hypothetical protein